ncbi:hypothetical protein [Phormidium sp. FACHB-592]|uniref:hypothetical protein n=1 Tax=Cyanophyceae TaxID=3028117 RepID=UPI00321FC2FC
MPFSIVSPLLNELSSRFSSLSLLATTEAANALIVLTSVLLTLVVIYLASKLGGELSK